MFIDLLAVLVLVLSAVGLVVAFIACLVAGNWIAAIAIAGGVTAGVWLIRS